MGIKDTDNNVSTFIFVYRLHSPTFYVNPKQIQFWLIEGYIPQYLKVFLDSVKYLQLVQNNEPVSQ